MKQRNFKYKYGYFGSWVVTTSATYKISDLVTAITTVLFTSILQCVAH